MRGAAGRIPPGARAAGFTGSAAATTAGGRAASRPVLGWNTRNAVLPRGAAFAVEGCGLAALFFGTAVAVRGATGAPARCPSLGPPGWKTRKCAELGSGVEDSVSAGPLFATARAGAGAAADFLSGRK
jgi:hypothetical protein